MSGAEPTLPSLDAPSAGWVWAEAVVPRGDDEGRECKLGPQDKTECDDLREKIAAVFKNVKYRTEGDRG
jgi:hypothetical protein